MRQVPTADELEAQYPDEDWDPSTLSDEEKEQFARGVMAMSIWSYVVKEDTGTVQRKLLKHEAVDEEWEKVMEGRSHQFFKAAADVYGIDARRMGGRTVFEEPYGERFGKAWTELGIEEIDREGMLHSLFLEGLFRDD